MYTNNYYYKLICETLTGDEITGHHTDIYYLELILGTYSVTYDSVKCKGKYLKDWYTALTTQTVTGSHPNVYYLRLIANFLTSQTLPWRTENYYLKLISENLEPTVTVQLSANPSTVTIGNSTTLTVTVLDEDREPIEDASVTIYDGETSIRTDTTDENGQVEYTYTPESVGSSSLSAVYSTYTSNIVALTVNKITTSVTITTTDNTIDVGESPSMSGVLSTEQSGKSIKIYKDSSQTALATVTTTSGGAWSYTDSATTTSGTISYYAVYEGDDTHTQATSSLLNIGVYKIGTTLTITPPTITLDETFDVVGNLSDANSTAISGATITLNWSVGGNSYSATETTDSNGDVTFHSSAPTTITTYTFQLSYAGNDMYSNSQSSEIEVEMSKISTNLTVNNPINNARVTPTDSITVDGYLLDGDGNDLASKDIKVKIGSTVLATTTTDSDALFSTVISSSSLETGSNTITVVFEGDNEYSSSTVTRTVIKGLYQVALTEADSKTILSEADSDTATLEATLTHGGIAVPNENVVFLTGTATTYNSSTTINEDWSGGFKVRFGNVYDSRQMQQKYLIIGVSSGSDDRIIYLPKGGNGNSNVILMSNSSMVTSFNCGEWLEYDNGVLKGSNGNTLDISSYNVDLTKNSTNGGETLYRDVIGVDVTDNNGVAECSYSSQGVGDVSFRALYGSVESNSYSIEDCFKYAPTEISKTPSSSSTDKIFPYDFDFSSEHFQIEIDIKQPLDTFAIGISPSNNSSFQYNIGTGISGIQHTFRTWKPTSATTNEGTDSSIPANYDTYHTIKYVYDNGTVSIYGNNNLIITYTGLSGLYQSINKTIGLQTWGTGTYYMKNLKIKPLISLSSDKSILSYADSTQQDPQQAVLTATHPLGTGKTVNLYDSSDDSLIGAMTDEGDGTYTYTYTSTGAGDIGFYAKSGNLVSESYTIRDRTFYDASSSSNLSKYTIPSGASMTYNSTNNCYEVTKTSNAGVSSILLNNQSFTKKVKISYDVQLITHSNNLQPRITLFNGNTGICGRIIYAPLASVYQLAIQQHTQTADGSSEIASTSYQPLMNTWYNMEVIYNNGTVTMNLKQENTVLATVTGNENILASTGNNFGIVISHSSGAKVYVKNIEIQEL